MTVDLYIDDAPETRAVVLSLTASYVAPWRAELHFPGRHDEALGIGLWTPVRIEDGGQVRFRGEITEIAPGGVGAEGLRVVAQDRRFRLENEPVRINGRGFYVWNRRGSACEEGDGPIDSPDADGGKWTAGQIIIDILEHALGLPNGSSDIPGHHGDACSIAHAYLTDDDIAGYDAADWLALDSVVGEFSVDNTPVADAISLLVALNGGFYGWHVDPATGGLVLRNLDALPTTTVQAGQAGQWQDAAGTDYRLLGNELEWSLEGVASRIIVQGRDRTEEQMPANIEDSGNPAKGTGGELERVAAPYGEWGAAYRPLCQPVRQVTGKTIDEEGDFTPPEGMVSATKLPRVYKGTPAGAKYVLTGPDGRYPRWHLPSGWILFHSDPGGALAWGERLWGWYWALAPFTVSAGPEGDAYHHYGYDRARTVYDPAFRHPTSWPQPGTEDDVTAMALLAVRLLRLYRDVRRQGTLRADGVDYALGLDRRFNVANLGSIDGAGPLAWDTLSINAVEATWRYDEQLTELRVANTFFMLEEYSELKRRLEMNLFARRELDLSEDIYACQVQPPTYRDEEEEDGYTTTERPTTTTEEPTTTTTEEPTTTTEEPTTTTEEPTTTTTEEPTTTTTEEPTTTTTEEPTTTTTEEPEPECPEDCEHCADHYEGAGAEWGPQRISGDVPVCEWPDGGGELDPFIADGDLECGVVLQPGHWKAPVRAFDETAMEWCYAVYYRDAEGDGDCPDGEYDLGPTDCPAPPMSITISPI